MKIIKLSAIDSTNSYLLRLIKKEEVEDLTVVVTEEQTEGRGQRGGNWISKAQKSLTFSIFKRFKDLSIQNQFYISFAVSIGIRNTLNFYKIPELTIKWPNDIMSHSRKLAGILIENQTKNSKIISSVIGVGVNVNEERMDHLPNAISMYLINGEEYSGEEIMMKMITSIMKELNRLENNDLKDIHFELENFLFKKGKISVFKKPKERPFNGFIRGVSETGELKIENEDGIITTFRLKEIEHLFQS